MPTGSLLGAPFFACATDTRRGRRSLPEAETLQVRSGQFYSSTPCVLRGLQPASARVRLITNMALPGEREVSNKSEKFTGWA